MDMSKIDLNAPAFGEGAQKPDAAVAPTEEAVAEPVVVTPEVTPVIEEEVTPSEEEGKVPYSRFKKFHDLARDNEAEALKWQAKAEALEQTFQRPAQDVPSSDMPDYWVRLYGDSPESQEGWKIQATQNEALKREAREEAIRAVEERQNEELTRTNANLDVIDSELEVLADYIGRPLTDKEQAAILDIVDEFIPKDDNGNYLGALIPFEKAWEIYDLKSKVATAPQRTARDGVASLTGTQVQGEPSATEANEKFNPMDWNAWKKRV